LQRDPPACRRELEDTAGRPAQEQTEQVPQVRPRFEADRTDWREIREDVQVKICRGPDG
jgi:hypothetical protein